MSRRARLDGPWLHRLPGLINMHTHSSVGTQFRGLTRSNHFELWLAELAGRDVLPLSANQCRALALTNGLENLEMGNVAVMDHCICPLEVEHVYATASAYEELGLRAWVMIEVCDLPWVAYTREAYPGFAHAVPESDLPASLRRFLDAAPAKEQLAAAESIISGWTGQKVRIGLAIGNPVWASDELIKGAAELAARSGVPLTVHAEESPVQHEVSRSVWGVSGIERLDQFGVLSESTVVAHAVHVDASDIDILRRSDALVCCNPLSNAKLRVGSAPISELLNGGVGICLGSDAGSSGDSQSLFSVMKMLVAEADSTNLRSVEGACEDLVLELVHRWASHYWPAEIAQDHLLLSEPLGPYGHVWDEPPRYLDEVVIGGRMRLNSARDTVRRQGAERVVEELRARVASSRAVHDGQEAANFIAGALEPLLGR